MDENRKPIPGSEIEFDCDTVLLSVGLIPENELSRGVGIQIDPRTNGPVVYENMETSIPGVFACGNVVHVHDLVDFVTAESKGAGGNAAKYILSEGIQEGADPVEKRGQCGYTVPRRSAPKCGNLCRGLSGCATSPRCCHQGDLGGRPSPPSSGAHGPGEMEKSSSPKALLDKAADEIVISVEKE